MIDIKALQHNFNVIKNRVSEASILAVVKADAYHHGIKIVASALKNADGFAVSTLNEAALIRQYFSKKSIVWLSGFSTSVELKDAIDLKVTPLIHHKEQLKILFSQPYFNPIDIFLKINTGMNRVGFSPAVFPDVYQQVMNCPSIKKTFTLMTHFAQAEDNDITQQQIATFDRLTKNLSNPMSLANSAAIWAYPESIRDCVRPGLALYGISPFKNQQKDLGLKPVMTFRARVTAINSCKKGERIGYGGAWTSERDTHLAVIDVGYADGYSRGAKNGTPVLINNTIYPLVGHVSMNMITVDLGPCSNVKINDSVTLWGEGLPIETIAKHSNTIPYTLLTGVSSPYQAKI